MSVVLVEVDPLLKAFVMENMIFWAFQLYNHWFVVSKIIDANGTFSCIFEILGAIDNFIVPHEVLDGLNPKLSGRLFPLWSGPVVKDAFETEPLVASLLISFGLPLSCLKICV